MKQQGNILIILVIILATVVIGAGAYMAVKKPTPEPSQVFPTPSPISEQKQSSLEDKQPKIYFAKNMKFSIEIPSDFVTEEASISVSLTSKEGVIEIIKNGTNYNSLQDYIEDFDTKRSLSVVESRKMQIDSHEALSRTIRFANNNINQKSYYIYVNYNVYIFSTSSEALYDDLDQIVQSFRYTP